jgi:hypothetical protein
MTILISSNVDLLDSSMQSWLKDMFLFGKSCAWKFTSQILQETNSNTWFSSLIATIVGNLKVSITNLHIRYEDTVR